MSFKSKNLFFGKQKKSFNKSFKYCKRLIMEEKSTAWDYGDEYAFGNDVEFIIPKIEHNIRPHGNQ